MKLNVTLYFFMCAFGSIPYRNDYATPLDQKEENAKLQRLTLKGIIVDCPVANPSPDFFFWLSRQKSMPVNISGLCLCELKLSKYIRMPCPRFDGDQVNGI